MPVGRVLIAVGMLLGLTVLFGVALGLVGGLIEERSEEHMSATLTVYAVFDPEFGGAYEVRIGGRGGKNVGEYDAESYEFGQLPLGLHSLTYTYEGEFHQVQIEIRKKGGFVTLWTGVPHAGPDDRVVITDMQGPQIELRRAADQQIRAEYQIF